MGDTGEDSIYFSLRPQEMFDLMEELCKECQEEARHIKALMHLTISRARLIREIREKGKPPN